MVGRIISCRVLVWGSKSTKFEIGFSNSINLCSHIHVLASLKPQFTQLLNSLQKAMIKSLLFMSLA